MVISEDLLNHRADVEPSNIKDCQLTGFSDETLANIFAVSKSLCGSKFELKLNDVRFVGHPISLEPDDNVEKVSRRTTLTMFHIVFALRAQCNYSIIPCYHELSQRLGLILRHEEERVGFLLFLFSPNFFFRWDISPSRCAALWMHRMRLADFILSNFEKYVSCRLAGCLSQSSSKNTNSALL